MLSEKKEKLLLYSTLSVLAIFLFYVCYTAEATFDTGDGIQHYLISHYSWKHPSLLLNHWGKPFFTLVSSPFSQFGLIGINVFQVLCAMCASYFCFRIAKKLQLQFAWILPVFICFSPIYFAVINTGLTEVFFSCMLILCIWLIFEKKYTLAAVAASFLPFVRVEAFVVLPLIVFVLLMRKQFIALPFLMAGFIIYSAIGFFHYGDLLWIIHQSQDFFSEGYENGKGDFFHYLFYYNQILGTTLSILFSAGLIWVVYTLIFSIYTKKVPAFFLEEIFLIYGSLFACLLLNTLSYWAPGVLTNLGMMRYMTTLIPAAALIALRGFNLCIAPIRKYSYICIAILLLVSYAIVKNPFTQWYYPFHVGNEEQVIAATGKWLKNFPKDYKVCYLHPYLTLVADLDPFDDTKITQLWSLDKEHLSTLADSTIIVWDSHYAPHEGGLPLALLMNDTNFIPLKHFQYYQDIAPFETWVFMKSSLRGLLSRSIPVEVVPNFDTFEIDSAFFDFDTSLPESKTLLSNEKSYSGQTAIGYSTRDEYGPVFSKKTKSIKNFNSLRGLQIDFQFFPCDSLKDVIPVIEIKDGDKNIVWIGNDFKQPLNINSWNVCRIRQAFSPQEIKENYTVVFYFWNKGKRKFFVDDLKIKYYGLK
jgi:hypothetical protein